MIEYYPPISSRDTEELVGIANGTTVEWQQEAIDQAKDELIKRKVSREEQDRMLEIWEQEFEQYELEYIKPMELEEQKQLAENLTKSYSIGKMIYIFLVAPFILIGRWDVDHSLMELKNQNYLKKYQQRLLLLIGGSIFWILIYIFFEYF